MDSAIATEEGSKHVDDEEAEEKDCRICRTPGDEDNPLLYPCACKGSIKFVHLDCLAQWLTRSNALQCEVCKHPFSFSPVYAENAPTRLPFHEFLVGIAIKSCRELPFYLRLSFVLSVYFLALPFVTFWIWRLAFVRSFGEAQRLFLSHISITAILTDCLLGFLLKLLASIVFFFLGETPLRDFFRRLGELGGREEREDDGDRNGIQPLAAQLVDDALTVNASNMICPVVVIFVPFTLGRVILYHVLWLIAAAKGPAVTVAMQFADTGLSLEYITPKSALTAVSNLTNEGQKNGLLCQLLEMVKVSGSKLTGANNTVSVAVDLLKASATGVSKLSDVTTLAVGYMFIIFLVYLYLGVSALIRYAKGEPSHLRQFLAEVRHLMAVIRISLFVIELGVFTLMYGWWLDLCTVRMFGKTISDRVQFLSISPLASSLLHLVVGFVYLVYSSEFEILLEGVLRPGVLNFLPYSDLNEIEDIIDDPIHKHAWKVLLIAAIDSSFIVVVVFLPVKLAIQMAPSIFPLHICVSDPFSEIPLWMLMFQLCIPSIIKHFRHGSLLYCWFSGVGWALGLTDFLLPRSEDNSGKDDGNGEPGRPNRAQVLLDNGPDRALDVLVAADDPNRSVLPSGNVNTGKEYEDDGEQSTLEYNFVLRIILLLLAACFTLVLFNSALIVVALPLGRALFSAIPLLPITNGIKCNDLHAFVTGIYVFLTIMSGARHAIQHVKSKSTSVLLNQIWKWCGIVFTSSVLLAIWVFIIPVLVGLLFELSVIIPMRVPVDESPVFLLYQVWSLGLIVLNIWTRLVMLDCMLPIVGDSWRAKFDRVREDGFSRLQGLWILREILFPIIMKLLKALCVPYVLARGVFPMLGYSPLVNSTVYRFAWICCLLFSFFCFYAKRCHLWFKNLHDSIRDDRYLIGWTILNFGEAALA